MKRTLFVLLIVCVCGGLLATSQTDRQRALKPAPAVKPAGKVDQFLAVIQGAASIKEIRAAFDQARFTLPERDSLKGKIEGSVAIRKKIETLQRQASAKAVAGASRVLKSSATARFARVKKQVTQKQAGELQARILGIKKELTATLRERKGFTADPNTACAADTPAFEKILGPITPGQEFAIEGQGLGSTPGSVDVMVDGRIFRARINGWNPCYVYAELERSVDGVRGGSATVVLETSSGKKASGDVAFQPLLDVRYEEAPMIELMGYCCGNSGDWQVFDFKLENDWYVCETGVKTLFVEDEDEPSTSGDGHAEITSGPEKFVGNVSARSMVHGGVGWFESMQIYVTLYIAGPKGLPHKF